MLATARVDVRLFNVLARARVDVSVKEEKGLWLACQSAGNCTGGRAHGPTAMLWVFFLLSGLMSSLFQQLRQKIPKERERRRPL